jgi:hypothetical protein
VARLPEFLETVNDLSGGAQDWIATDKVITPHIYSPSNLPPQLKKEAFQALAEYHAKAHDARFKELAKSNIRYLFDNEFNPSLWAEFKKENGIKDKFYEESPLLLRPLA